MENYFFNENTYLSRSEDFTKNDYNIARKFA